MEAPRRLIGQINEQIKLLNPSQKLAILLCAVIVAGSLAWLLTWSASPQLVPLLSQDLAFDELDAAEGALAASGIDYEIRGSRIFVGQAEQADAIRILNRADALPQDTSIGFQALIEDDSPFRPESQNAMRYQVALGNELAKVIASAPDVASARVFIQSQIKRKLTGPGTVPTASAFVTMAKGKQITQASVEAFARLVSGAVPGLKPHEVKVIYAVTLRYYDVADPENAWAADMLERKKQEEQHLLNKIHEQLSYIPGVLAAVTVELDGSKKTTKVNMWADPSPKSEESRNFKTSSGKTPGETGTNPNVGVALAGSGTASGSEEKEVKTHFYDTKPNETTVSEGVPFAIKRATAAINIPRSFFVSVFKAQPGNEKTDPADGEPVFEVIKKKEKERVRSIVQNIIMAKADEDVRVESYYDFDPGTGRPRDLPAGLVQAGLGEGQGYTDLAYRYGPEVGLLLLALFSLFILVMMVRRSTRATSAIPTPTYKPEEEELELVTGRDGILHVPGGPVGEADMPDGMLQGEEVDDDTLKFKQLGEQVSRMVEKSPQVAADLLKRWVDSE